VFRGPVDSFAFLLPVGNDNFGRLLSCPPLSTLFCTFPPLRTLCLGFGAAYLLAGTRVFQDRPNQLVPETPFFFLPLFLPPMPPLQTPTNTSSFFSTGQASSQGGVSSRFGLVARFYFFFFFSACQLFSCFFNLIRIYGRSLKFLQRRWPLIFIWFQVFLIFDDFMPDVTSFKRVP